MKKEERTELTKKKIISAAIKEFGENGYKGASLNNICSTGIPKGLLYHNYESRDAVYIACVKHCFSGLMQAFRDAAPKDDLHNYMSVRLDFFNNHPFESHIIFESAFQKPENLQAEIQLARKEFDEFNLEFFKRILDTVSLRDSVSKKDALEYFTMMQSMFNVYFGSDEFFELSVSDRAVKHEENLAKLLEFMLYGIVKGER